MNSLTKLNRFTLVTVLLLAGLVCNGVFAGETKIATFRGWTIILPDGWNGDDNVGIYWQGEGSLAMGRPALSIHMGGIPLMPDASFEDKVKKHANGELVDKKEITVEGLTGFTCYWESQGKKHFGIYLEEKLGGGVGVIHFVDCQAPAKQFAEFKEAFEATIKTVKK